MHSSAHPSTRRMLSPAFVSSQPKGCRTAKRLYRPCACAVDSKTKEYNREMQQKMGWEHLNPYEYHYDRGLYYHEIDRHLICGSQPRNPDDIVALREEVNVTTIVNLQQDKDMKYWGVSLESIRAKSKEVGIKFIRCPARDFDPESLRKVIPSAVQSIHEALSTNNRVYVHCTAGLGRAPAVCIAFLYWFRGMGLDDAYKHLTSLRPCGPKRDAIRGATYDLLSDGDFHAFSRLPQDAYATLNDEDRYALQYRVLKEAARCTV